MVASVTNTAGRMKTAAASIAPDFHATASAVAMANPRNPLPASPMNIRRVRERFHGRNPATDPDTAAHAMHSSVSAWSHANPPTAVMIRTPDDAANPSMPSIKLVRLIIHAVANVITIP
jgi:hypothetical protein